MRSPFADTLLQLMRELRATRQPVKTVVLADMTVASTRTVQRYLAALETEQRVRRPSPKGGWLLVAA